MEGTPKSQAIDQVPKLQLKQKIAGLSKQAGMGAYGIDSYFVQIQSSLGLSWDDELLLHSDDLEDNVIAMSIINAFAKPYTITKDSKVQEAFKRLQKLVFQFVQDEYGDSSAEGLGKVIVLERFKLGKEEGLDLVYAQLPIDLKTDPEILACVLDRNNVNRIFVGALPENCFADFDVAQAINFLEVGRNSLGNVFNFVEDFPHLHNNQEFREYVMETYPPTTDLFKSDYFKSMKIDIPEYKQALLSSLLGRGLDPNMSEEDIDDLTERNRELYESNQAHNKYFLVLKKPGVLTVNPPKISYQSGMRGGSGVEASKNTDGGFDFSLEEGNKFSSFKWIENSLAGLGLGQGENKSLVDAGYGMDKNRSMLQWETSNDSGVILLSADLNKPGVVSICKNGGVEVLDMEEHFKTNGFQLRKPVIYLYPEQEQEISVALDLKDGVVFVEYPKRNDGRWNVLASPSGDLVDLSTNKRFNYLFWEAERKTPFEINMNDCFCIPGKESEKFLETHLEILGLNDKEKNDFIVYWLPLLERNEFNLISFLQDEYTDNAELIVNPVPDSLIRVFMIFKPTSQKHNVTAPVLKKITRNGFSVVEWGGMDISDFSGKVR